MITHRPWRTDADSHLAILIAREQSGGLSAADGSKSLPW